MLEPESDRVKERVHELLEFARRRGSCLLWATRTARKGSESCPGILDATTANPPVSLDISGQPIATQIGHREFLEKKANDLNLGSRVRFVGGYPRLREVLVSAKMLVVPSLAEGTPTVLMEALPMGVPVVASNVGGLFELAKNGRTGV